MWVYGKLGEPHFDVQRPFLLAIYVVEMTSGTFLHAVNTVVRRKVPLFIVVHELNPHRWILAD